MGPDEAWLKLSTREQDVVYQRALGLTMAQVAYNLGITEQTVKNHCSNVRAKLNASSWLAVYSIIGWLKTPALTLTPRSIVRQHLAVRVAVRLG